MSDKAFIDTNIFIYLYSEDEKENIVQALKIHSKYGYKYFDCLMVASALNSGSKFLFTEDLADGQIINNQLTIVNIYKQKNIDKYLN